MTTCLSSKPFCHNVYSAFNPVVSLGSNAYMRVAISLSATHTQHGHAVLPVWLGALQARVALIESDACKLALKQLDQELLPPAGYNAATHMPAAAAAAADTAAGAAADVDVGPGAADVGDDGVRLPPATVEQLQRLLVEVSQVPAASSMVEMR